MEVTEFEVLEIETDPPRPSGRNPGRAEDEDVVVVTDIRAMLQIVGDEDVVMVELESEVVMPVGDTGPFSDLAGDEK